MATPSNVLIVDVKEPASKRARQGYGGSRLTPFQKKHILEYGLAISARDPFTSAVIAVRCRFCVLFGREGRENNSKIASSCWTFEGPPFRPENFRQHHLKNHPNKWKEYKSSSNEEMKTFFNDLEGENFANTIHAYLETQSSKLHFCIAKEIVDVIILDFFLSSNAQETVSSLFEFDVVKNKYIVEVSQVKQFELAVRFVGHGMSFRMAAAAIQDAKQILSIPKLGFCNELHVSKYVRIACASSFQAIMDALSTSWAFAVAFDGFTDTHGTSFIDVRIRFFSATKIQNLHVVAIPFARSHTEGQQCTRCSPNFSRLFVQIAKAN